MTNKWIKIKAEQKDGEVLWSEPYQEDNLVEAAEWIKKNWVEGQKLGIRMVNNESADYVLFPEDMPAQKVWALEDEVAFEGKEEFLKNLGRTD